MRRTTKGWAAALVCCLLAALLVGCDEEPDARRNRGEKIHRLETYVALGDSYTAGPLLGAPTGPPGCGQTDGNYPHRLAKRLDLQLVDVSCGGATTDDLEHPQNSSGRVQVPAQLEAVAGDTDLVTLGIGGNDARAFATLVGLCVGLAQKDRAGAPCTAIATGRQGQVDQQMAGLQGRIVDAIGAIIERAPDARVIVVGYPQIFPESGECDQLPLARGDYRLAHDYMHQLVEVQRKAAEAAHAEYVDVWSATAGHDICADDPWIAGMKPQRKGFAYHPYSEEQEVVADLLAEQVKKG